jgi:predicted nucleic acid-binding protein
MLADFRHERSTKDYGSGSARSAAPGARFFGERSYRHREAGTGARSCRESLSATATAAWEGPFVDQPPGAERGPQVIALDTSSIIAYLSGAAGSDVDAVEIALRSEQAVFPPVVLCELLSDPVLPTSVSQVVQQVPLLAILGGFWERAGFLRAKLIAKGRKARLADTLIAQACLDHDLPLVTRDTDFRHFARISNLKLLA